MKLLVISLLVLLLSCGNDAVNEKHQQYKEIEEYFKKRQKLNLDTSYSYLLVLSERGCYACNKKFNAFIQENIRKNNKTIYLITAKGGYIDVSNYVSLTDSQSNILFDQNIEKTKYEVLKNESKAIFLNHKEKKIDSTIIIDAKNYMDKVLYIQQKIDNHD